MKTMKSRWPGFVVAVVEKLLNKIACRHSGGGYASTYMIVRH